MIPRLKDISVLVDIPEQALTTEFYDFLLTLEDIGMLVMILLAGAKTNKAKVRINR